MRGTLAAIIKNLEPGGGVEKQVMRLGQKAKRKIIETFNSTEAKRQKKKSVYRTQKYGGKGTLLKAIEKQKPVIEWKGGDIRLQVLDMNLLPLYWKTQEFGFTPAQTGTWRQRFFIVAYRSKNKLSKRGDNFVLKSIRKEPSKGKHIYLTVQHKNGMIARHFIRAGRQVLTRGRISIMGDNKGAAFTGR
jgi:hypothetical protein